MSTVQDRLEFAREFVVGGRHWRTRLDERLKPIGMSHARWTVLYWLSETKSGISQTALAELAGVEAPTLVRMIDLLEKEGLVERRSSSTDRRVNLLHLTESARSVVARVEAVADELRREVLGDIPAEDLQKVTAVLRGIRARLDKVSAEAAPMAAA